ncbi:MAG TPA: 2-oxoacid:acceptor oxidoreductase subunit alpha [Vicinamibacterales bacterium]|nr:2-oxoacid:acceptor oxidoreductase subunit alpha [Vicinamibacterales bacterium]
MNPSTDATRIMTTDLVIGMAGSGGDGIVSAGEALIAAAAREGYHALMTKSYGPQIRGGESSCRVRIATERLNSPGGALDLAVALNWDYFLKFGAELTVSGSTVVVWDSASGVTADRLPLPGVTPAYALAVPLSELTRAAAGSDKMKNSLVLGLLSGWIGMPPAAILTGLKKRFLRKGEALWQASERAFQAGFEYAQAQPIETGLRLIPAARPAGAAAKLLTDGNEMSAAAAIFAGCRFFGGYPITPSSEVMQFLTREIWKYGGTALQAEDEIAGVASALGASLAGTKAMTATSGPGMDLKTEVLGLASMAEVPLVVINVQRGGPSTGLPTRAEQGDLFQACFSAHGDVLRPVLAPTSVADTFDMVVEAFNIAEQYQTPVIVLSDQEIAQRKETVDPIDTSRIRIVDRQRPAESELQDYRRFLNTESGVSPMSCPGMAGGAYLGSGIEHNEAGAPASSGTMHTLMNEKRFRKLRPLQQRADLLVEEGDPGAPIAMVSWGSSAGVCREALRRAQANGLRVKLLVPRLLYPVADDAYVRFFSGVQAGLFVEQSYQGQLHKIVRMSVDLPANVQSLCRSGANPFRPAEVYERLEALARSLQGRAADAQAVEE